MGSRLSGLGNALYDSKRREFLGRDGAKWSKLGVFYFFFYLGLAGFFCAMLAVFMALTPRDHPYYTAEDSRMTTRSNPLSPGLGFRPQPDVERNLIETERSNLKNITQRYVDSLKQYLRVYYWNQPSNGRNIGSNKQDLTLAPFSINNPGECIENNNYGYTTGRPCVLVKLNKIVDFIPEPLDLKDIPKQYSPSHDILPIICSGEYAADNDNIGKIRYYSENGINDYYGSLKQSRFPYPGKQDRKDVYQAPYIWVQFLNPRPNVLINVICQAYGKNIDVDKKTGRGLTRFQIFSTKEMERKARQLGDL